MTPSQRVFAVIASVTVFAFIVEMVRRRHLKEEYAWLWVLTGAGMVVLASWYGLIEWITHLIGAVTPTTTLFLFGLLFLLLISVHFSMVISRLTQQVRRLVQELALLEAELDRPSPREGSPEPARDA